MTAITNEVCEVSPNAGLKIIHLFTGAMNSADTTSVNLADYGISTLYNVITQVHSTDNSVVKTEAATTAVAAGVLTVTAASSNDGKKRSILVIGQ